MDAKRFDDLTASLATSRRSVMRLLAGTTLGGVMVRVNGGEAAAACTAVGKKCKRKKDTCCGTGVCKKGRCRCKGAAVACGKRCCAPGQACQQGKCVNGSLAQGAICKPKQAKACQSGRCECISNGELTQCTCRAEACFGFGVSCTNTSQCCEGGCDGFTETCQPIG